MGIRLLLVDDHTMFRAGLRSLLQAHYPDVVVDEAEDGATALRCAEVEKPTVVLLDIHLPDQSGLEVCRQLHTCCATARVIMLSAEADLSYVNEALKVGASAYLLKSCAPEELRQAIDMVLGGKLYLCAEANQAILENYSQALRACTSERPLLSGREQEVLRYIAEGLRTKEIAARLQLGVKSVETYRRRLMKKLACSSTAELVRYALREGIIQP